LLGRFLSLTYIKNHQKKRSSYFSAVSIENVMFQYLDVNEEVMNDIPADKLYTSWALRADPFQASSFYHLNK